MDNKNRENDSDTQCATPECCSNQSGEETASCCIPVEGKRGVKIFKAIAFFSIIILAASVLMYSLFVKKKAAVAESSCSVLESFTELKEIMLGKNVLFIIVAGNNNEELKSITKKAENTINVLSKEKKIGGIYQLNKGNVNYNKIVKEFNINYFPAVLTLGEFGGVSLVNGDITENSLLKNYKIVERKPSVPCCSE